MSKDVPDATDRKRTFLREWRTFRKLSQEQAAAQIDVRQGTLSKIERGELPYHQDFLERAAETYACDVQELLSVDPRQPDPLKLVYLNLRKAPQDVRERAISVIDALLKAG